MPFLLRRAAVPMALAFVALVSVPRTAAAFCRTTTELLPANYSPKDGCFTKGQVLFWRGTCLSYSINQDASQNIPFDDAKRIIDQSFGTWMATTCVETGQRPGISITNLGKAACAEVKYNKESPNQNLIVFRDNGWPYKDPNSTLGLTTVTFDTVTGEIFDADMEINASDRNLSITDAVPADGFDLASVVTHEAGHFFGLAHATETTSTMYASYKPGSIALRDLTPDDVAGLCAMYPSTTIRPVDPSVAPPAGVLQATACDPNPRHGLAFKCVEPVPPKVDDCHMAPIPTTTTTPWSASSVMVVVAGLVLAARRRRKRLTS